MRMLTAFLGGYVGGRYPRPEEPKYWYAKPPAQPPQAWVPPPPRTPAKTTLDAPERPF